jgi:hypothetical protein
MTRSPRRLREQVKDTVSELPIQAARLAVMGVGRALLLTDRVRKDYRDVRESGLRPVLGRLKNDAENITGMVVDKVAGNGTAEEAPRSRDDSEISVGKPKPAAPSRPSSARRPSTPSKPATAPPPRPADASRPKPPTAAKPTAAKSAPSKPAAKPTEKPAEKPAATKPATKPASKASTAKPRPATQDKPSPTARPKAAAPKPAAKPKASTTEKAPTTEKANAPAKPAAKPTPTSPAAEGLPVTGYDKATIASVRARLRGLDAKQVAELRDYERSHAARADFLRMYENRIAKLRGER